MKLFLRKEDKKSVKDYIKELSDKKYEDGASIESGGLYVRKEIWEDGTILYDVFRLIGTKTVKVKK